MTLTGDGDKPVAFATHELTFLDWQQCLDWGGCNGYLPSDEDWGRGRRPVINVSFEHAESYLSWLNGWRGIGIDDPYRYRLPTADEWEQAAGLGSRYNWGDSPPNCMRGSLRSAAFIDCSRSGLMERGTMQVGFSAPVNGLYDMHGNVAEWTSTCAPDDCTRRILKGGSWQDEAFFLHATRRGAAPAASYAPTAGIRVARGIAPQPGLSE